METFQSCAISSISDSSVEAVNVSTDFLLHKCIINNDLQLLSKHVSERDVNEKDMHGNTPLQLAVMKGQHDVVDLLLDRGAVVKTRNKQGWGPMAEAISFGDRQIITKLYCALNQQSGDSVQQQRPQLAHALSDVSDFYLEVKWLFTTWIPLLHRFLPSDTCRVVKRGSCLRIDSTLADFNDFRWQRGDITLLFMGTDRCTSGRNTANTDSAPSVYVMDNQKKVYQKLSHDLPDKVVENDVDMLMSTDIVSVQMPIEDVRFSERKHGWFSKSTRQELVGKYRATVYDVQGISMVTHKRREHLTADDLSYNKQLVQSLMSSDSTGGAGLGLNQETQSNHRRSLAPPSESIVNWNEYSSAEFGSAPHIGRPMRVKRQVKQFRASVSMSEDFEMPIETLITVLGIVAPFKKFSKLRDFIRCQLPVGFPVKVELPLLPVLNAEATFQECIMPYDAADHLFHVPEDYKLDTTRFSGSR